MAKDSSMWNFRREELPGGRGLLFAVHLRLKPAAFADVFRAWQDEADFRTLFNKQLANAPFSAFRWETPPVTSAGATRPFEFVLLDSPELIRRAEPEAFAAYFRGAAEGDVVEFPNLGGDAMMVVPCPVGTESAYAHLAAFVRNAPEPQRHALWQAVGKAIERRLSVRPVWVSTAGAGVAWLHVRLDDRPKYYGHRPFRQGS